MDGSIIDYTYNPQMECLEKRNVKKVSNYDTTGMKVLNLNIKKVFFDQIIKGEKKTEYRGIKTNNLKQIYLYR